MTRTTVLGAVALVLAGAVAWQYWPQPATPRPAPKPPLAVQVAVESAAGAEALQAHPLFSPSRQPPPEAAPPVTPPPAPVVVPEVAPVSEVPSGPILQGLVLTPMPGAAYLGDPASGKSVFLRPGETAFGLTLQSVEPGRARFKGPEGEVVLPLTKAPEAQDPAAPAPALEPEPTVDEPQAPPSTPDTLPPDAFAPVKEAP